MRRIGGLIDFSDAGDRIDEADLDDEVPLPDPQALDTLESALAADPDHVQILAGDGSDVVHGAAGNDHLLDREFDDAAPPDVFAGGAGDDTVQIEGGVNLAAPGGGRDILIVGTSCSAPDDDPVAVVTDFDPEEDALILTVHMPAGSGSGQSDGTEIGFVLHEIDTAPGRGTLVAPRTGNWPTCWEMPISAMRCFRA